MKQRKYTLESIMLKTLQEIKSAPGRNIIIIGANFRWAKMDNGEQAYRKAGMPKEFIAYDCHEKVYVTNSGLRINAEDNPDNLPEDELVKEIGRRRYEK